MNIEDWLDQSSVTFQSEASESPETPSSEPTGASQQPDGCKRRRAMSYSSREPSPPKRRRTNIDEVDQRTSLTSELSDRPRLRSSTSTTSGRVSPTRDIFNQLRLACPAIICEPQATGVLPNMVVSMRKRLSDGFGHHVIPRSFKSLIYASDPAGAEEIPESAYFDTGDMPNPTLDALWDELEGIRFDARHCDMYGKDESAWCLDVVQPILLSNLRETNKLQLISVQSQQIDISLLPVMNKSLIRINKKADYAFALSCRDPEVLELYQKVSLGGHGYEISQTTDAFTKRVILFSGVEVKPDDGGKKEALAQLAIWLAANLEKNRQLGKLARGEDADRQDWLLPTVGYTIIGHDWYTYIVYKIENEVHVVGPISAVVADSRSIYGILKLRDLVYRVKRYALEVYWPWVRDEILRPLASRK